MKKSTMKLMALLLTAVMAVTPASTSYAAADAPIDAVVMDTEEATTEDVTAEDATEAETPAEETEDVADEEVAEEGTDDATDVENPEEGIESETEAEVPTEGEADAEVREEDATDSDEEEVVAPEEYIEESVSDNAAEESTVSDNTVSENAVNDNTVSDNDVEVTFPGMGEDYVLTARQEASKKSLANSMDEFEDMVEGTHYISGEVIYSTDSAEEAQAVADAYGGTLDSYFDGVAVIKLAEGVSVRSAVYAALHSDKVTLPPVYPNYYRVEYTDEVASVTAADGWVETASHRANDPYLAVGSGYYQWQHYSVGSMYAWNAGYTGAGIKVAVIDSGVQATHPDLKANVVYNYNAMAGTTTDTDDTTSGHGTHVAGIIAADDNTVGGRGIAPDAQIYNLRVFGEHAASGSAAAIARAVNHAVSQGVDIINMSLGGVGYTYDEYMSVVNAKNAGVAVFVAAGNDGSKTECYPAAFPESICVAAVDKGNGRAVFSNYGSWVDLAGPGVDIYSTYPTALESEIGVTGYDIMSGTSQATPVIAGTAAVVLSANPKALQGKTGAEKVNALVKLMATGATKATGGAMGKGVVNLPKVLKISGAAAKPAKPVYDVKTGTIYAETVTTTVSAAFDCDIYYSTDGKTPTLKNGVVINGQKATSNPQSITVNGIVNGKATGRVTVKAIAVNKFTMTASPVASVTYTLKPAVASVAITGATTNLTAGKSLTLKAAVTPAYAANKTVKWEISGDSSETGVSITAGGVVKATKTAVADTYTVTATPKDGKGGTPGEYTVTVLAAPQVKSIKFDPTSVKLSMKSEAVNYNLADIMVAEKVDGSVAVASEFIWTSSKPTVATVNEETGVVTTKGAGTTTITALAADGSGVKKTCNVTVTQLAQTITITQPVNTANTETVLLAAGKGVTLKAAVAPASTKNKAVDWSITGDSEQTGVSISKTGKVTATKTAVADTYIVTATAKDGSGTIDTINVTVYSGATTKVMLSEKAITLFRKTTSFGAPVSDTITVSTEGDAGYTADYTVTSSNPNVVKVSKDGNTITVRASGYATGTSTIKVAMNDGSGKTATCKVTVKNPVSKLSIAPEAGRTGYLAKGKSLKLSAIYEEEFGKATKKVTWSVVEGAGVVKVDKNSGKVTALQGYVPVDEESAYPGYAVVQAEVTDGSGVKATYVIRTFEAIESIQLYPYKETNDGPYLVNVYFNGWYNWSEVGVYPEVNVEVSNTNIASVNNSYAYGQFEVYLWAPGRVQVTVKATDGSGKKATTTIWL